MERESRDIKPLLLLVFLNILGIMVLIINGNEASHDLSILSTLMCVVSIAAYVVITKFNLGDPYLFIIVSMLSSVGIIMISRLSAERGTGQLKWYLVGVAAFSVVLFGYRTLNKYLRKWTALYYLAAVLLFLATLIFGTEENGAKNWLFGIQPSEFIRILYVMALAAVLCKSRDMGLGWLGKRFEFFNFDAMTEKRKKWMRLFFAAGIAGSCAAFLLLQTELGTLLVFGVVYIAFLYVYGDSKPFLFLNLAAVICAASVAVMFYTHVQSRVTGWKCPLGTFYKEGNQIVYSLTAIGAGGFGGSGIGNGIPGSLQAQATDSIFAVICEDMGLLGGIAILMLYFLLVYRGFKIALSCTNPFNKAVSMGLSVVIGIQTFIIVGGITNLIPLTGITLPFVSAGGSSMVSTFMIVGILQAISSLKGESTDELE